MSLEELYKDTHFTAAPVWHGVSGGESGFSIAIALANARAKVRGVRQRIRSAPASSRELNVRWMVEDASL